MSKIAHKIASSIFVGCLSILAITLVKSATDVMVESTNERDTTVVVSVSNEEETTKKFNLFNLCTNEVLAQEKPEIVIEDEEVESEVLERIEYSDETKLVAYDNSQKVIIVDDSEDGEDIEPAEENYDDSEEYIHDDQGEYTMIRSEEGDAISRYSSQTDLSSHREITVEKMNKLIDHFVAGRDSEFTGTGEAFIQASLETGYDPVFLLSLAGNEASWEVSKLHARKNNPYSINMTDSNPGGGYMLGDTFDEGIINGAIWIHEKYYDTGKTNLHLMIHGGRKYSSSGDHWINTICSTMNECYSVLDSI